jgi:phosphoribosylformimino-5-aminoimidazole carboxamide ribotide isomerase
MTRFRPCIDLHAGQVKQIVGGTLSTIENDLKTNHVSTLPAGHFADLYREKNALGAHVIMLGPGNEQAAVEALSAWPGHLQIGGGITDENAKKWMDAGAEKVVLCSSPLSSSLLSLLSNHCQSPCEIIHVIATVLERC